MAIERARGVVAAVVFGAILAASPSAIHAQPAAGPATAAPPAATTDPDRPVRKASGKVFPSTDPDLAPALGPNPAKVVVVVYSDFQCPVCARVTDATHQIPEEWPGEVRVEFHQHALAMHANAENAAVAALAAQRQGKFWELHDVLFAHQSALDPESLVSYAQSTGLDVDRFRKDYADPRLRSRVREESALADRLGATGTPAFFVNGAKSVGWGSWDGFRSNVARELDVVNGMLAKGTKLGDVYALRAKENAKDEASFAAFRAGVVDPLARVAAASSSQKRR
jgi:protein-disulfide isomerase